MFQLCHFSLGLQFTVVGGIIFSFDDQLDCHATIISLRLVKLVRVLKIVSNIKKFCDLLLKK